MNEHNAKRLAYRYWKQDAGQWCRIYYCAQLMIDWRDLLNYTRVLKGRL